MWSAPQDAHPHHPQVRADDTVPSTNRSTSSCAPPWPTPPAPDPAPSLDRSSFTIAWQAARDQLINAAAVIAGTSIDLAGAIGRRSNGTVAATSDMLGRVGRGITRPVA
jgi:hypothetical protein